MVYLKVLEVNLDTGDKSSLWLQHSGRPLSIPRTSSQYYLALSEPRPLVNTREQYSSQGTAAEFTLVDTVKSGAVVTGSDSQFDLVILKVT